MDQEPSVWRNLRHWSLHVTLSAAASFTFACRTEWRGPWAVAGMVAGVLTFIALYTWVWSSRWFRRFVPAGSAGRRALLYGTRARSTIGVLGFLGFLPDVRTYPPFHVAGLCFIPDLWAGILACSVVAQFGRLPFVRSLRIAIAGSDPHLRAHNVFVGSTHSLLPTYLITVADGLVLTIVLLALSWFCRLFIAALHRPDRPAPLPADPEF